MIALGKYFGTDGVRGVANQELTPELAFRLGRAGTVVLGTKTRRPQIAIGCDTRISGPMFEAALTAGITSAGGDVALLGVVPTPAVAYSTRTMGVDAGIMISASHNPAADNGIKFFSSTGYKLSDELEDQIESVLGQEVANRPVGSDVGTVGRHESARNKYLDYLAASVPVTLSNLHIAVDCANGAAFEAAPRLLRRLGAAVTVVNDKPTGTNINEHCGSTCPQALQDLVRSVGADIGFTYDGDADRVLAVDENGELVDGDHILAICGLHRLAGGQLPKKAVAATVYSNGGLKRAFQQAGGDVVVTAAGDRYVLEAMLKHGLAVGGEQSGHIIFAEHSTTGDGLLTTLHLLAVLAEERTPLSEMAAVLSAIPQRLVNVEVSSKTGWEDNPVICTAVNNTEDRLKPLGRLFVRASGTEPKLRILAEHPDKQLLDSAVDSLAAVIEKEQGEPTVSQEVEWW